MLIPVIKVFDKATEYEHIVGTNHHDRLIVDKHKITYGNLQNGCGTDDDGGYGYEFVVPKTEKQSWADPHIEFVTLEEFITMSEEQISEEVHNKIELYSMFKDMMKEDLERAKKETGIKGDTSGGVID